MRRLLLLVTVAMLAILSTSARAQFCPGAAPWVFDDVPAGDLFCGYITWAAQNGITLGCAVIDANHRLYCPGDPVRRDQMAALLNRLGNVRVEAVGTGPGLTGGPITGIGTINLAATNLLPTTACATNQIPKWNGSAWTCSADANSGGTVTSVGSGTGLSGGPITSTGTLSIATGYQLPQGCTNGQVAKSNGSNVWTCASDAIGTGTVTSITAGNGLTGGTITTSGTIAVDPTASTFTDTFFLQGGNAFGGIASATLGTTNNLALDVVVNNTRAFRLEPYGTSPNVIGGHASNSRDNAFGNIGSAIGGGGKAGANCYEPSDGTSTRSCANLVKGNFSFVGGGHANQAGGDYSIVAGGQSNSAAGFVSTVGGGFGNIASGASDSTIGGGSSNMATAQNATVGGGFTNTASAPQATVGGGAGNIASGAWATVPGGVLNKASGALSFAAGSRAMTETADPVPIVHDGTFVFSDFSSGNVFRTTTPNEFAVRATGGVRFVTAVDGAGGATRAVKVNPNGELDFGSQARQMLNLWGPSIYGMGVQTATLYSRTSQFFAWFMGGSHSDSAYDPGVGGQVLATLQTGAGATTVVGTFRAQAFTATSDRNAKTDFALADGAEVLDKVVSLPIATWSYHNEQASGVRHIGPTAQDFKERFGVGYDDKTIATVDADGVALAAIQGLNAKVESQAREIAELRRALEVLMARVSADGRVASR